MICELNEIYDSFKNIKENLVKLSKTRRTEKILNEKLIESKILYDRYLTVSEKVEETIKSSEFKSSDLEYIRTVCSGIQTLYTKIVEFCNSSIEKANTMEKFDLKTAVSLLPMMNGDEDVTKKLIDAIELYSSMLEKDSEKTLVNFILKTRLSESAKLRLSQSYSNCQVLLSDMKEHLLTKKSSNAIHAQLVKETQGSSDVDEYGKRLEQLFTDLTISQADGNCNAYQILKPINEKLAIKSFTDGLRNNNLKIILAARNYSSLKDVIRAAKDEELSASALPRRDETMFIGRYGRTSTFNRGYNRRGQRRGQQVYRYQNQNPPPNSHYGPGTSAQVNNRGRVFHRGPRSNRFNSRNRLFRQNRLVNFITTDNVTPDIASTSETEFFRA